MIDIYVINLKKRTDRLERVKKDFVKYQYPEPIIDAMKALKMSLDPAGIMAPGNIF